jgi:hypothetical protein
VETRVTACPRTDPGGWYSRTGLPPRVFDGETFLGRGMRETRFWGHRSCGTVIRSHVTAPFWQRRRSIRRQRSANCSPFCSFAPCRTRSSPWDMLSRLGVRRMPCSIAFPLALTVEPSPRPRIDAGVSDPNRRPAGAPVWRQTLHVYACGGQGSDPKRSETLDLSASVCGKPALESLMLSSPRRDNRGYRA